MLVCKQWRRDSGGPTGLDNTAVILTLREHGVKNRKQILEQLDLIENACLIEWAHQSKQRLEAARRR